MHKTSLKQSVILCCILYFIIDNVIYRNCLYALLESEREASSFVGNLFHWHCLFEWLYEVQRRFFAKESRLIDRLTENRNESSYKCRGVSASWRQKRCHLSLSVHPFEFHAPTINERHAIYAIKGSQGRCVVWMPFPGGVQGGVATFIDAEGIDKPDKLAGKDSIDQLAALLD